MPNRRKFVSSAATLAAAAQLGPRLFAQGSSTKDRLGFALVGLGRLSTDQLAPAFEKSDRCRLVGIVSGSETKPEEWKKKYDLDSKNIYNYRNFDQIADNPDIDVVYVVLPNAMHEEFVVRSAKAGKHVYCEKPMSVSAQECRQMIDACDGAKVHLGVGYRCQFEPHHLECMRLAREKTFGELRHIEAGFGFPIGDYPVGDLRRWRLEHELAGGGALMDVGIYALQACRYLTGEEPRSVLAREIKTDPVKFAEVDETILWSMDFPGGVVASCSTTYGFGGINKFTATATKGQFGLDPAYSYGGIKGFAGDRPIEAPEIDQFAKEMDAFAKAIQEDKRSKVAGEEGLRDQLVIDAIYESVRTGRRVDVAPQQRSS
ncbi:Gfo/Idh/MocA family oxidoreductase [Roseiconus nitratireducens]|uniref:Gfo/Idh/MocA family oxidoreductase n=1 Tax=Roseiconus nitratireducens TaxID=2605748 RepID=A0A5M6D0A8_9BACT|nr:Gfo/Idh/MocA family oxidoreductase [Roseiconus nitratireducens]KAA5540918.1 Gfo/Idh/MocA family oxidoreductase [Roseiconus nitratireducens]